MASGNEGGAAAPSSLLPALAGSSAPVAPAGARPASLGAPYAVPVGQRPSTGVLAALGAELFADPALSASGQTSCASCHDPAHGHAPANRRSTQRAGADGRTPGVRAAPSLRYLQTVPPFTEHHHDSEGDDSVDAGPAGGRTWDGRAASAHEQASLPLLSAMEMANGSAAGFVARLRAAPSGQRFVAVFGAALLERPAEAFAAATMALEVYQEEPRTFQPFSSKYDAVLRGTARLSAAEARGLAAFDDPKRGNCASCHPSALGADGALPLFTDFGHVALGVPRNRALAANADPRYFDLGLCGPWRTDLRDHPEYCGRFRTPSLRNVAARGSFFHNGVVHRLADAVRFYVERDRHPERWYVGAAAGPARFDDLPERYHRNVETGAPFGRSPRPRLEPHEVRDIVAFLRTLSDADVNGQLGELPGRCSIRRRRRGCSKAAAHPQTSTSSISR